MKDRFRKLITGKRIPLLLAAVLLLLCVPVIGMVASAGGTDTRVVDPSTMDTWTNYFGPSQPKTEYAGDVWMDKSVLTDASALPAGIAMEGSENESFLVALSAMASNSSITGQATYPTDTILVLDVSGSMNSGGNDAGADLAAAANSSIATLQNANPNNRVALVLYSGDTGNSASSAVTLLPLGRWTTAADGIYINYESTGGFFGRESLGVDEDVRDAVGGGNPATNETDISGATYIQRGISQAMNMFTATDNEVTVDGQQRLPVLVLMSDGAPTLSSTNFTNPGAHNLGNGQTSSITAGQGFVTQLTAAYAKTQIEAKYGTDMLFYTLGFRVDADSVAESVLNPTGSIAAIDNFWSSYDAASVGSTVFVQDGASVTKIGTALSQNYVTSYFSASSDLQAVFQNIISDSLLQSKYSPTLVEGNENMDGLISFVDRIGAYMEVKNIQGILIHDDLFSGADLSSNFVPGGGLLGDYANPTEMGIALVSAVQQRLGIADYNVAANLLGLAYTHGQLAYTDDTNFSNYVGWYANAAGEYLGFWHEGVTTPPETTGNAATDPAFKVKSYYYLGEVDESHGVSKSDMMYAVVQLRENISTGDQILTFGIPSALIPTTSYEVELDEYDTLQGLTVSGAEQPMRLVYEVGLRDEINSLTVQDANIVDPAYVSANRNPDGSINFYTNEYERDGSVGYGAANSYSYFRPSHQNERYYYQADAMIYTDTAGTLYNSTTAPAAGTAYYNRRSIYSNIGGLHEEYVYHEIAEESLETAAPLGDGSWYIPAGNILASMADYQMAKSVNSTATLGNYADAFVDLRDSNGNPIGVAAPGHDYVVGSTLGNNGRLSISPSVGILLRKDLEAGTADTGETFMFTITGSAADAGQTYPGYLMDVDKSLSPVSTSFDASGVARVGLKAGQRLFITEMTESRGYTITEDESVEYILHSVNGDTSATQANVITQEEGLVNVGFVNARRGKGEFTLIKMLEHDLGAEHTIPSDLDFLISVQLSGVGTANASFPAELSGMGSTTVTTDATGSFSYYLKDQEHLLVSDLPIGTEVVVTENVGALDPGFSHRGFYDDGIIGGDGRVSISGSNSVVVVNGYEADPVHPVDLDLTVEKRVELADGTEVTDWSDREFNFVLSRYNADTGTWDTVATQTSNNSQKSFSFDLSGEDYSAPGSYSYRVVEEAGTEEGMYYDPVIRSFTVVVSDADMDGQLDISRVYSIRSGAEYSRDPISGKWNVDMDFTNVLHSVSPAYIAIPIQKIMNNPSNSPLASLAGYEFGVYADAECSTALSSSSMPGVLDVNAFSSGLYGDAFVYVSFDAAGTYTFYLKETAGSETYIDYSDVVVSVSITVDADAAGQLYTVGAPVYTPDTVLNTTTYEVEFENSYEPDPASLDLSAHLFKNMDGRALNAGDVFTFEVREAYTDTLRASGSSQADGSIVFDTPLSFTEVGNYDFIARETSPDGNGVTTDKTGYHFRVTVSDNGSGELVTTLSVAEGTGGNIYFNNVYQANAVSYQISGSKILDGAALSGGQFSFRMQEADASGNALPGGRSWQNTNDAAGNFLFPELTYTEPGDYYYSISEIENTLMPGIQFDESIFLIHVKVEDDAMGQLQVSVDVDGDPAKEILFRNSYVPQPVKVPLDGIKFLDGRDSMTAGTYEFELYSSDAAWSEGSLLETVANAADGRFSFSLLGNATVGGERVFDAPGSYYYLVKEKNGGSEINGIIYSSEVQRVRVDVSDNGRGLLEAVVNIYSSTGIPQAGVSFTNEARILEGKSLLLTGLKTLSGKTLESNQFHFNLYEADSSYTKGALLDTVSNTGNSFQFEIAYEPEDLGKTFYYLVEEQYGGTQRDNINYDGRSYRVSVQVGDNGDRSLLLTQTVENGPILFENSYIPNSASVTFSGTKSLTGRALAAGEFSFDLYAADAAFHYSGAPLRSTTNAADGSFSFGALILSEAKTYNFVIKENSLSPLSGITYDTKHYNCAVVVEDVAGQLQITSQSIADNLGNSATSADFENSYDPADAHLSLSGTKSLSGRALQNGEFRFLLYKAEDASYSVSSSTIPSETVNAADGSFTFDSLHFDTAGSYYYVVKEDSSLLVPHVSMDPREYKIEITVVDNGGQLEASYKLDGSETTAIAFENIYTPDAGSTSFSGTKSLNGRALAADEFSFELFKTDDSFTVADPAIMTVKNAADGSFSFADVPLSTAGNYYFVIRESAAAPLPGMSYDSRSYCISLQVADVDGVYTVTSQSITEAGNPVTEILFENDYTVTPTSTSFSGTKSLSGRALAADEFSFELFKTDDSFALVDPAIMEVKNAADGSFSFADVPLTTVGTHYFVIREKSTPLLPGVSYDSTSYFLTVVVEDVDAVLAVSSLSISNGLETVTELSFENSYAPLPTSTSFTGTKSLTGRALAAEEFSFELFKTDDSFTVADPAIMTVKNAADGSFSFADVPLTTVGTHYFVIRESAAAPLPGVSYDSRSYFLTVVVEDVGGSLGVSSQSLADENGIVTELRFENSYAAAPTSTSFSGTKSLIGRTLVADAFSFELFKTDASFALVNPAIMTVKNAADGSFTFADVPLSTAGTHYFVIRENKSAALPGMSYDANSYFLTVVVEDVDALLTVVNVSMMDDGGAATEIKFENSYIPAETKTSFSGMKSLSGRALAADEFSFDLFETDASFSPAGPALMTVKNAADGSFVFENVLLQEEKTYYFLVKENQEAPLPGVSYDSKSYRWTIEVERAGDQLQIKNSLLQDESGTVTEMLFENSYTAAPTSVSFNGTKSLTGRALAADEFSFELFETDDSFALVDPAIMEVKNAADGSFTFADVPLTTAGSHYFVIREKSTPLLPGVSYDSSSYFLTVVVEDVDAVLTVSSLSISNGLETVTELSFENSYTTTPTSVSFSGTKSLTGRALAADEFSFELFETDDSFALVDPAIMTVKNAADGSFTFADVPLTTAGTHYFVIRENKSAALPGISYDSRSYFLTVVVEDVDAVLTVSSQSITDGTAPVTELKFENSYTTTPTSVSFNGTKSLSGRTLAAEEFSFDLFKTDDSFALVDPAIMTVKNAADGSFSFADVPLTTAGTHYFVIRENKSAALPGISYDSSSYFLTVVVEDVDSLLGVSSQSVTDGTAPVTEIRFANSYAAAPTSFSLSGTKSLSGRTLAAEEFSFDLFQADPSFAISSTPIMTVKNAADGSFSFTDVPLTTVGTHYFVIRENKSAALPGISYDSSSYFLTVVVEDVDGALTVSSQSLADENAAVTALSFANSYVEEIPPALEVELHVEKRVRNLGSEEIGPEKFNFRLEDQESGETMDVLSDEEGAACFRLNYSVEDVGREFSYRIWELDEEEEYIRYSNAEYEVKVTIRQDESSNALLAELSLDGESVESVSMEFVNEYDYTPEPPIIPSRPISDDGDAEDGGIGDGGEDDPSDGTGDPADGTGDPADGTGDASGDSGDSKPTSGSQTKPSAPQTGDESQPLLWFGILLASAAVLSGILILHERKRRAAK